MQDWRVVVRLLRRRSSALAFSLVVPTLGEADSVVLDARGVVLAQLGVLGDLMVDCLRVLERDAGSVSSVPLPSLPEKGCSAQLGPTGRRYL